MIAALPNSGTVGVEEDSVKLDDAEVGDTERTGRIRNDILG